MNVVHKDTEQEDDNPFGSIDEPPMHAVIGVCKLCGEDAHVTLDDDPLCWGCAYSEANWQP